MALSYISRTFLTKTKVSLLPVRSGYIVLLPEVPVDIPDDPLLKAEGIPEINTLTTEKCSNAVKKYAFDFESEVWRIEDKLKEVPAEDVFKDVLDPLEKAGAPLDTSWGLVKALYLTNKELMPGNHYLMIHEQAKRCRASRFRSLPIYKACKEADTGKMTEEQQRVTGKYLTEGRLNGLDLDSLGALKLGQTLVKMSKERDKFISNVNTSTENFEHVISENNKGLVKHFPENLLRMMGGTSSQGPWKVTLEPRLYEKFLEYCPDRDLRWNLWQAYNRRASKASNQTHDNSVVLEELRFLKKLQAQFLGFENYGAMSMETKMAGSIENVKKMLDSLLDRAFPVQEEEVIAMQDFAISQGEFSAVQIWDIPYWTRVQRSAAFIDLDKQLNEYFPLPHVLSGLFTLCEQLFGVYIKERKGVTTWHPDVQYFDIFTEESGKPIAGFFLDAYSREGKLWSHNIEELGWVVGLRNRSAVADMTPLTALVLNLPPPQNDKPTLLSFPALTLLFQKFGHVLQYVLTQTTYSEVSGLSNIEWDAVDICSNFMVHWLYDINTMKLISRHVETGETLPSEMTEKLHEVRKHMAGFNLCKELYLARLDIELQTDKVFWRNVMEDLWPKHFAFPLDGKDNHPCSLISIICGEWCAAYYSRIWAQVMAADVFSAFPVAGMENGEDQATVGRRFRSTFLELGGGCHSGEVFRRFRGRDPTPKALLNCLGLKKKPEVEKLKS